MMNEKDELMGEVIKSNINFWVTKPLRNDDYNTIHNLAIAIRQAGYIKKYENKPFLCKCRNDDNGAMTVKRINDDFHQCPRCGGLFPIGYIKRSEVEVACKKCSEFTEIVEEANRQKIGMLRNIIKKAERLIPLTKTNEWNDLYKEIKQTE